MRLTLRLLGIPVVNLALDRHAEPDVDETSHGAPTADLTPAGFGFVPAGVEYAKPQPIPREWQ